MSFVVLSASDVERLLPMRECIDVMARAFVDVERVAVSQPLRSLFVLQDNPARGLDSHQGQVILAAAEHVLAKALDTGAGITVG